MSEAVHPRSCTAEDPLDAPFEAFLDAKAATGSGDDRSGSYAANLERVVGDWIGGMKEAGIETFADLESDDIAQWASDYLASNVRRYRASEANSDSGFSAATAYYGFVSAYLSYAVKWEIIDSNPAKTQIAQGEVPEKPRQDSADQQFWSPEQRMEITRFARRRAGDALDEKGKDALPEVRDHALVYTIGYSGVRGSEILRMPRGDDHRRIGATWTDINFDDATIEVLGKDQKREVAPLTSKPIPPLQRLYDLLEPADDEWPVFPTFHAPTLWSHVRDQLNSRNHEGATVDELLASIDDPLEACRKYNITPPALTTEGGRQVLKRLTEEADVDVSDGDKSYLTLHGARRGVGEQYYREGSVEAAQRVLRHDDPETTSKMYSHIEASDLSKAGDEVFQNE
jgi:integrase